jgi:hypothetical protein
MDSRETEGTRRRGASNTVSVQTHGTQEADSRCVPALKSLKGFFPSRLSDISRLSLARAHVSTDWTLTSTGTTALIARKMNGCLPVVLNVDSY